MALFWLFLVILMLALMLSTICLEEAGPVEPHGTIETIATQAQREVQDLSEDFLRKAIDLLNQERR